MIKAIGDVTTSKGDKGDPLLRYHVIVKGTSGFNVMAEGSAERDYIDRWIITNCTGEVTPGSYDTLFFEAEADAILFWLTFK